MDRLPVRRLVVRVSEPGAPVAEVRAHDEDARWVFEIRSEDFAAAPLGVGARGADEDGHEWWEGGGGEVQREHFVDVGEVHFETVFFFVVGESHAVEEIGGGEFGDGRLVKSEITQGSFVSLAVRERTASEVIVVGGTEEEDSFTTGHAVSALEEKERRKGMKNLATISTSLRSYTPMLLQDQSMRNQRACKA